MNKRFMKVITLILSCLLLIGAAVGITVAAEDNAPAVSIEKKNVAYEGAIQLVYLVTANNLPEGAVPAIRFEANNKDAYVKTAAGTVTLSEVEYDAIYSDGIVAKEYRLALKSTPGYVLNGEFVEAGEAENFSAYDYAMTRFDGTYSAAQFNLYKALLDYGAAVQEVLEYNDENVATLGGWIDEYYRITLNGVANNKRGDFDGIIETPRFNEAGEGFTGWTDGEGNTVVGWTTLTVKPGTTVIDANYAPLIAGTETFDSALTGDSAIKFEDYSAGDDKVTATVENGYVNFGKVDKQVDGSKLVYNFVGGAKYAQQYVYETDFNLKAWDITKNEWVHKVAIWGAGNAELVNFAIYKSDGRIKIGDYFFDVDTWHHLKMSIIIHDNGSYETAAYVDGYRVVSSPQATLSGGVDFKAIKAGVQMRDSSYHDCKNASFLMDNTVAYTVGDPVTVTIPLDANGGEGDETFTATYGAEYTLPTPTKGETPFVGWYYGDKLVPQTGTWTLYGMKAVTLTAAWAKSVNVTLDATGGECEKESLTVNENGEYELPVPTMSGLAFGGWYNGDQFVENKGTWPVGGESEVKLTAKWLLITADNDFADKLNIKKTAWSYVSTYSFVADNSAIDAVGTKYTFSMTYTYHGLSAFTLDAATGAVTGNGKDKNYGFVRAYNVASPADASIVHASNVGVSGNFVNANGDVVVKDGKLIENSGITADTQIFYSQINWWGLSFEIGEEYDLVFEFVMNGVGNKPTITLTATDEAGNVRTAKQSVAGKVPTAGNHFGSFAFVSRDEGTYSFTQSFANANVVISVPCEDVEVTLDVNGGNLPTETPVNYTFTTGMPYTLPTPTVADGVKFLGWYNGDTLITNEGIWGVSNDVTLKAKWALSTLTDAVDPGVFTGNKYVSTGATAATKDEIGTKYVFTFDYSYNGLTGFADIVDGVLVRHKGTTSHDPDYNYGFPRVYGFDSNGSEKIMRDGTVKVSGNYIDKDGNVVADSTGKILDEYVGKVTANDIFFEKLTWYGITFLKDAEYEITMTVIMGANKASTTILVEAYEKGSDVLYGEYKSTSAYDVINVSRFYLEYRGGGYVGAYSNKQTITNAWVEKIFPTAFTITQKNVANVNGKNETKSLFTKDATYDENKVDVEGTRFIVKSDYTYKGIGGVFVIDPETFAVTSNYKSGDFAYIGFYTKNSNGTRLRYSGLTPVDGCELVTADGKVVVDENGVLLKEYQDLYKAGEFDAGKIFYSKITWGGVTFEIGKTYKLTLSYTCGAVTYTDGVATGAAFGPATITAELDGVVQNGTGFKTSTSHFNVQGFSFYWRGASAVQKDLTSYTANQSFENNVITVITPVTE